MKTENILHEIQNFSSVQVIPAKKVLIKKVLSIQEIKELKNRLPFLKKAIMTEGKILYENNMKPLGSSIKSIWLKNYYHDIL